VSVRPGCPAAAAPAAPPRSVPVAFCLLPFAFYLLPFAFLPCCLLPFVIFIFFVYAGFQI